MRLFVATALAMILSAPAQAVGDLDDTPPTPTETTTICEDGQVHDPATNTCRAPREAGLDDDGLFRAVRELAYAGRYAGASAALDAMADQDASRVSTYRGFIARRTGDWDTARRHYAAALAADPGNLLARSYLGQGLVAAGDLAGAAAQLSEIRARGGRNTWAEASLALVLRGGDAPAY